MIVIHKDRDITDYVSSISWGGSRTEVARKLEIKVINAPLDKNITPLIIDLADPIYLYEDDRVTERFRGFVVDREANSVTGVVTYVAYDLLFYTLKSKATYNFSDKSAETIAKLVCEDVKIPTGELAVTGLNQKLIVQNVSIYEIIMQAYTQAFQKNGKKYRVTAKKGKLNVEEVGKVVCEIEIAEDSNILSSNYKETLTNMVNKVKIYDGKGNLSSVVQNDAEVKRYGIFQQVYTKEEGKDPTTTAKSMFKGVEKTFTLTCVNINEAVTGVGAIVKDSATGLKGLVWIDSDVHTWTNGVATMTLTVTLKALMDEKKAQEPPKEQKKGEKSSKSTQTGGTGNKNDPTKPYAPTTGSKTNPPFEVVNKYWRTEMEGFMTYAQALSYYSSHNGKTNGWKILDASRKEVLA